VPLSTTPFKLVVLLARFTDAPLFREVTVEPTVSVKLTEPDGEFEVWPVAVSVTVAVIVTDWPLTTEVGLVVTVVAVLSFKFRPVPLTETCSVLPVTLRVLLVTVMPALRLLADCGVKFTETSHTVPGDNELEEVQGLVSLPLLEKFAV